MSRELVSAPSLMVGRTDRLIALRQFPAFATLAPEDAQAIANRARERRLSAGEVLFREDEPIDQVAFVVRGKVRTQRHGKVLGTYDERSVVGSLATLSELTDGFGVVALEPTTVITLPAEELLEVFEDHFTVVRTVLRGLASGLLDIRRRMGSGGFQPSEWQPGPQAPPPLDLVGRIAQLRDAMPFAGARMEALADLARDVRETRLDADVQLWEEGEPSGAWLFILHGLVEVESSSGMTTTFGPGDVIGALGTLASVPRWYSARTTTELVALRTDDEALFDVMEDHFDFALALIRSMARGYMMLLEQTGLPEG